MCYFDIYWVILTIFCIILGIFVSFWHLLGHLGIFWVIWATIFVILGLSLTVTPSKEVLSKASMKSLSQIRLLKECFDYFYPN